jgi:hypothetical protein
VNAELVVSPWKTPLFGKDMHIYTAAQEKNTTPGFVASEVDSRTC